MVAKTVKETVMENLRTLPDDASWEDIHYHIYVQQSVAAGVADIEAGRVFRHEDVKRSFNVK